MGFQIIVREFLRDKVALGALIIFMLVVLIIVLWNLRVDAAEIMQVNILNRFKNQNHSLGAY